MLFGISDGNPISALDPNGDAIPGVYVLATTLDRNLALELNGDPYYSARLTYDRRQARVEPLRVSREGLRTTEASLAKRDSQGRALYVSASDGSATTVDPLLARRDGSGRAVYVQAWTRDDGEAVSTPVYEAKEWEIVRASDGTTVRSILSTTDRRFRFVGLRALIATWADHQGATKVGVSGGLDIFLYFAADGQETVIRDYAKVDSEGRPLYVRDDGTGETTNRSEAKVDSQGRALYVAAVVEATTANRDMVARKAADGSPLFVPYGYLPRGDGYVYMASRGTVTTDVSRALRDANGDPVLARDAKGAEISGTYVAETTTDRSEAAYSEDALGNRVYLYAARFTVDSDEAKDFGGLSCGGRGVMVRCGVFRCFVRLARTLRRVTWRLGRLRRWRIRRLFTSGALLTTLGMRRLLLCTRLVRGARRRIVTRLGLILRVGSFT